MLTLVLLVVNCFQFVIWRSLTHHKTIRQTESPGCELLSICDLTIFDTPLYSGNSSGWWLWIAFNLWFDDLWHTYYEAHESHTAVVNCFQFVIWRSLTHPSILRVQSPQSCELLSICDLTIFDTPVVKFTVIYVQLWIAFNLWFDDLWHTASSTLRPACSVVNCFQFVIWRSLTHHVSFY